MTNFSLVDGRDEVELGITESELRWSVGPRSSVSTVDAHRWRGRMVMRIGPFDLGQPWAARFVFLGVPAAHQDEFDRWYGTEHLPNLAAVPGVVAAARFRGEGDGLPPNLAVYQLASLDIPATPAWLRAGASDWSDVVHEHVVARQRFEYWAGQIQPSRVEGL